MEPDKKRNRGFVGPHNLEDNHDTGPTEQDQPSDPPPLPPRSRWLIIALISALLVVCIILKLRNPDPPVPPLPSSEPPAPTEVMYTENGFTIIRTEARYVDRSLAAGNPYFYDMLFNSGMNEEDAGSIAPAADTNAVSMKALRLSDLVFAVFYRQNTEMSALLCKQVDGLPDAPRQIEETVSLPAEGIIYVSMDSLLSSDEWISGDIVLSLMIDGKQAMRQTLTVVP